MNVFARILTGLVVLAAAGCAGTGSGVGPSTVAPTVDVTGRWVGTWSAVRTTFGGGSIEMTLKQAGSQYSGSLNISGTPTTNPSGPTEGVVTGNVVRVLRPTGLTGTLTVDGDTMTGTIAGVIEGNVTLKRQQ